MRFVLLGNPENRRVEFFARAAHDAGATVDVRSYLDFIDEPGRLAERLDAESVLRIESPGENWEVERGLLRAGIAAAEAEGSPVLEASAIGRLDFDRGLILHPRQVYLGFRSLLQSVGEILAAVPGVRVMNDPGEIAVMFDKRETHALCVAGGVPVPDSLGPIGSYDELRNWMSETGTSRVFVKPANGSSASGVVALHVGEDFVRAVTSVEMVGTGSDSRLYNSLRVRTYTNEADVRTLLDALAPHVLHVERWRPKANPTGAGNVDLRIVVVDGRAGHVVVRRSRGPITNLHLGNRREDLDAIRAVVPDDRWAGILADAERAAGLFPRSLYAGVDVLPEPGFRRHTIAEVNAFGDLLPGVTCDGRDTYAAEVEAVLDG